MGMAVLYCKCLFCCLICYIGASSSWWVIWWVSACAQHWMTEEKLPVLRLRFLSLGCRIQQGWNCSVNGSLIWLALNSRSGICLWSTVPIQFLYDSVLLKLVRRCLQSCRIQAILLDKSSSPLIPTLTVVTYLNVSQKKLSFLLLIALPFMR